MRDDFDERLTRRLKALDATVPRPLIKEGAMSRSRSVRVRTRFPFGLAAGLVVVVAVVAVASATLRNSSSVGANESSAPSESAAAASQTAVVLSSASSASASSVVLAAGVVITGVQAIPLAGTGNPVSVVGRIENQTSADISLVGASSPVATSGGLYATSGKMPDLTDKSGMGSFRLMTGILIPAGQSLQLRHGDGEIVLNGLAKPLLPGDQVDVTFKFESGDSVTLTVPVVSSAN
jgi:copper(I)-binding protein